MPAVAIGSGGSFEGRYIQLKFEGASIDVQSPHSLSDTRPYCRDSLYFETEAIFADKPY